MSCCEVSGTNERIPGTGCCGSSCSSVKRGCLASEPRIRSCLCQENVGCVDRSDCGGFRPRGTAATGACPGPCQCAEEDAWNINIPPKPNCEWLSNFSELRRQWSDHSRQQNCKCCNCHPCRKAAPCKPCSTTTSSYSGNTQSSSKDCQVCCKERLSGGGSSPRSNNSSSPGSPPNYNSQNHNFEPHSSPHSFENSRCQPCLPSPRPILKKRSCCQCISGYCMCQPMPRNCNCPPPVQVDARAEKECSCDCPSSPECACPPSERRFPRTKIRCPNAKMCCPLPRLPPGPKCLCSECQPCLPPPCDPCTSTKCKTIPPKTRPCQADSAPRPGSSAKSSRSYRHQSDPSSCTSCRKMPSTYRDNNNEALQSQVRGINRPRSSYSRPGQSSGPDNARDGDEDGVVADEKFRLCNFGYFLNDADDVGVAVEGVKVCDCLVPPVGSGDAELLFKTLKRGGCDLMTYFGCISRSIFVPSTTTVISFVLLILGAITWASGFAFYHRYMCPKRELEAKIIVVVAPLVLKPQCRGELNGNDQECCESSSNLSTPMNSFLCPVCLSLLSSNTCCREQKVLEFDREFGEKPDQVDSSFYCAEESKDFVCEGQIEESFNNCKNNRQVIEWEEGKHISEIESALKINERDEDECIDQFEDNVQYCTDYDPSALCNATVLESTAIFKREEQLECSQKEICNNSLMKAETNPCHQKISSSEENLLIKNKISTSSNNERQDPVDSLTDITICFNNNRKTILLKSEDQFYPRNRKTASCNCKVESKNKEPEPKIRSSRKSSFHYRDTSFFDGWNNLKNALGSYFHNRISPNSCKPEEKKEYKSCSSSAEENERERKEMRKMDLNDKERRDVGTQNSQPRGDICLKITNINRLDSFRNSRKNVNHTKRSNTESTESKAVSSKDKIQKHNKDNTSAGSDCTISWSLDRALINIQPENNEDMILDINMQPKDNKNDNMEILNSAENADSLFPDDSTIIRDEDKVNYAIDVTNDNLSESSSNECLVHPRKDNCISECEFRRNDNDQRVGSEELKQHKNNFHNCSTSGFGEMRKKEDLTQRRNFFQGIKFTTSKIQNH